MTNSWKQRVRYFLVAVIAAMLAALVTYKASRGAPTPLVHKLLFPLLLSGVGPAHQNCLLPAGTSLYYDQAFPEGFVRYKVFVNVEGVKLESRAANEKFWIDPLTAFPVDAEKLPRLLRDHAVSKEDLTAILKSGQIYKADIRALLEEYSR